MADIFTINALTGEMLLLLDMPGGKSYLSIDADCTESELVGDVVYINDLSSVRRASSSDIITAKVAGVVVEKSSDTRCKIATVGIVDNFTNLVPGSVYFLNSVPGTITRDPPTIPGSVLTIVGKALTNTSLLLNLSNIYTIRS